jgi:hypothetical protein
VAHTKRRRRTKHRGNAAGVVEARGRTGRPPTAAEKKRAGGGAKATAREKRLAKYDKPPTWRGAFNRAMVAALLMLVVSFLLLKNPTAALTLFPLVLLMYVPMGYYVDLFLYRRRQRDKARKAG